MSECNKECSGSSGCLELILLLIILVSQCSKSDERILNSIRDNCEPRSYEKFNMEKHHAENNEFQHRQED